MSSSDPARYYRLVIFDSGNDESADRCRCELCRAAANQHNRERRAQGGDRVREPTYSQICLAALSALGGTATPRQVRDQLDREGVHITALQVSEALRGLSRRMNPAVEIAGGSGARKGKPGMWQLLP